MRSRDSLGWLVGADRSCGAKTLPVLKNEVPTAAKSAVARAVDRRAACAYVPHAAPRPGAAPRRRDSYVNQSCVLSASPFASNVKKDAPRRRKPTANERKQASKEPGKEPGGREPPAPRRRLQPPGRARLVGRSRTEGRRFQGLGPAIKKDRADARWFYSSIFPSLAEEGRIRIESEIRLRPVRESVPIKTVLHRN